MNYHSRTNLSITDRPLYHRVMKACVEL